MLKIFQKVLAIVFVLGIVFLSSSSVDAAKLKVDENVPKHTATIIAEKMVKNQVIEVVDLSGIKKMSAAVKWIEDNVPGGNWRFVSVDVELAESWKNANIQAGFKPKNPEENYKRVSAKAKQILKKGNNVSFEIKTVQTGEDDGKKIMSGLLLGATIWSLCS